MKILIGALAFLITITSSAETTKSFLRSSEADIYANEIAKKPEVTIGMSQDEVLNHSNYGIPLDILTTHTAKELLETWVYEGRRYLYFNNGTVVKIQK